MKSSTQNKKRRETHTLKKKNMVVKREMVVCDVSRQLSQIKDKTIEICVTIDVVNSFSSKTLLKPYPEIFTAGGSTELQSTMELKMGSNLPSTALTEFTLQPLRTQLYPWQHLPSMSIWQRSKWRTQTKIRCVKKTERRGKRKYPSERRKPREKQVDTGDTKSRQDGYWRFVKVPVPVEKDPGKDHIGVSDALMEAIARYIKFPVRILS